MRLEGRMRLGYFPLDQREAQRMRRFLQFSNEPASTLDPCEWDKPAKPLEAYEAQLLMAAGDVSRVRAAPLWRRVNALK